MAGPLVVKAGRPGPNARRRRPPRFRSASSGAPVRRSTSAPRAADDRSRNMALGGALGPALGRSPSSLDACRRRHLVAPLRTPKVATPAQPVAGPGARAAFLTLSGRSADPTTGRVGPPPQGGAHRHPDGESASSVVAGRVAITSRSGRRSAEIAMIKGESHALSKLGPNGVAGQSDVSRVDDVRGVGQPRS